MCMADGSILEQADSATYTPGRHISPSENPLVYREDINIQRKFSFLDTDYLD